MNATARRCETFSCTIRASARFVSRMRTALARCQACDSFHFASRPKRSDLLNRVIDLLAIKCGVCGRVALDARECLNSRRLNPGLLSS
jgi:hypothetical protein